MDPKLSNLDVPRPCEFARIHGRRSGMNGTFVVSFMVAFLAGLDKCHERDALPRCCWVMEYNMGNT